MDNNPPSMCEPGPQVGIEADIADPAKPGPYTPYIKMDAMAFGMGCCCLQITFQAWNVDEARRVYDALVPVAPIMVCIILDPWTQTAYYMAAS